MKVGKFRRLVDRVPNAGYLLEFVGFTQIFPVNERVGQKDWIST